MHIGHRNDRTNYTIYGNTLLKTEVEKDLGILVADNLKASSHVAAIAAKANSRIGIIKRNFEFIDKEIFLPLYLTLVRPILEYAVQCWSPHLQQDIDVLEKVQRRATKVVPELAHLSYEQRYRELGLQTLKERRLRGDMIEVYKLLNGLEDIDYRKFFRLSNRRSRGHSLKLEKVQCRTTLRANYFSLRVVNPWNALPQEVVEAPSISAFKSRYDRHISGNLQGQYLGLA